MTYEEIKSIAESVYEYLRPYCIAIYLGGSYCQDFIENKHDVDFICFADAPVDMCHIRRLLHFYQLRHDLPEGCDFLQVRTKRREERAYGSYVNRDMIKLVGEEIEFEFDPAGDDWEEYRCVLMDAIRKLESGKIRNQKRWYQVLRGYCILRHRSYDLTEDEKLVINEIHDQAEGWERHKITISDLLRLK